MRAPGAPGGKARGEARGDQMVDDIGFERERFGHDHSGQHVGEEGRGLKTPRAQPGDAV